MVQRWWTAPQDHITDFYLCICEIEHWALVLCIHLLGAKPWTNKSLFCVQIQSCSNVSTNQNAPSSLHPTLFFFPLFVLLWLFLITNILKMWHIGCHIPERNQSACCDFQTLNYRPDCHQSHSSLALFLYATAKESTHVIIKSIKLFFNFM